MKLLGSLGVGDGGAWEPGARGVARIRRSLVPWCSSYFRSRSMVLWHRGSHMARYHVSREARRSCTMTCAVDRVPLLPCWSNGTAVSQDGWVRPCVLPNCLHGWSSRGSIGVVACGWRARYLSLKHSSTCEWSAHSSMCSGVSFGSLHLAHSYSSRVLYTSGYHDRCRSSVGGTP